MGLSKEEQAAADAVQAALDEADSKQNQRDGIALAKAVEEGDEEAAADAAARLKRRGAY